MSNPVLDFGWKPTNVIADTLVRTGRGVLHSIVLNGLTTAGDCAVYDGVDNTGTLIATLHLDLTTSVSVQPITFLYDVEVLVGIYLDYDATLVADLTVSHH